MILRNIFTLKKKNNFLKIWEVKSEVKSEVK